MKKAMVFFALMFVAVSALAMSSPPAGQAGGFSLEDLSGRTVTLDSFKGHLVLVAFFTTWCPSCQDEMPQLQQIYDKYRSREFYVLGINIRGARDEVKDFAKSYKLNFPIVLDEDGSVAMQFKVKYIPKIFIFDKSGKMIFQAQYLPMELIEKEVVKDLQ